VKSRGGAGKEEGREPGNVALWNPEKVPYQPKAPLPSEDAEKPCGTRPRVCDEECCMCAWSNRVLVSGLVPARCPLTEDEAI
jgi:hypothetical protein